MIDRRLLSKRLSAIAAAPIEEALAAENNSSRRARIIGITGSPGVGKSSLIGRMAPLRLRGAGTLAIVAIDPSSPRTEGSLLGDRIRLGAIADDPRVFVRSLPSRAASDGLTENVAAILAELDAAGFDEILIETVGAGQTAYGVRALADVTLLALSPATGDLVQAMKAGIMETADLYVVNKADLPGADRLASELLSVLEHGRADPPPVLKTSAEDVAGWLALSAALDTQLERACDPVLRAARDHEARRYTVTRLIERRLQQVLKQLPETVWDQPATIAYAAVIEKMAEPNRSGLAQRC